MATNKSSKQSLSAPIRFNAITNIDWGDASGSMQDTGKTNNHCLFYLEK